MADTASHLLDLIDAYAAARADRDDAYSNSAAWAFDESHRAMLAARATVADALGIRNPEPPRDEITDAAERAAAEHERRWANILGGTAS